MATPEGWNHTLNPPAQVWADMGISERMGDVLGQAVESKLLKEVQELSLIHISEPTRPY